MGDRGNIIVHTESDDKSVYLYTHMDGHDLPKILQQALRRKQRWDDPSYLTHIIFCTMIGSDTRGETGYGISASMGDGGVDITVHVEAEIVEYKGQKWSFNEYIALEDPNKTLLGGGT